MEVPGYPAGLFSALSITAASCVWLVWCLGIAPCKPGVANAVTALGPGLRPHGRFGRRWRHGADLSHQMAGSVQHNVTRGPGTVRARSPM
jgi:hypothetical protein